KVKSIQQVMQTQRKIWEVALRRKDFIATDESVLCCEHFKTEDFDRTGQTVRLRADVIPSIFKFPAHLQTVDMYTPTLHTCTLPSLKHARICVPATNILILMVLAVGCIDEIKNDVALKKRLIQETEHVISLEREKSNSRKRELRAKNHLKDVLQELREKNLMNEELSQRLGFYAGKMK
uniref:THAP-type domain-containing protein n=1 Tax=Myripristis murdjan TaxID=586833 RepID=A0A667XA01_9TELE